MDQENSQKNENKGLTKEQLRNRLYEQGFSHYTIPSVVRENKKNKTGQPLVARLYSLENNLIKSVKQPQTSIFSNQKITNNSQNPEIQKAFENQINYGYTTAINSLSKKDSLSKKKRITQYVQNHNQQQITKNTRAQQLSEQELAQTKLVFKKLRSTFLENTKQYRSQPKAIQPIVHRLKKKQTKNISIKNLIQNETENHPIRQCQSELDTYINLLLRNSPNVDEFVYLVQNPENDDPYDLILKNYFQIAQQKKKRKKNALPPLSNNQTLSNQMDYYTISIKGLCRFKEGKPVEFISLTEWLKERETYDKIRKLGFFADFLKWKTVQVWKKSYKSFKKKVAMKNLEEKLFINYHELKEATFQTKEILYRMSQLVFLDFGFMKDSNLDIISINDFLTLQEDKASQTQQMIAGLAKDCHSVYVKSLEDRLELLRNEVAINSESDNAFKKNNNEQFVQMKENPYETLGFPETMSYDKRSVLRKECFRFIKFAYFIDFLAVDCLTKIYLNSVQLFISEVSQRSELNEPVVITDPEKSKGLGLKDAIFKITLKHNLDYEYQKDNFNIVKETVPDFKFPKIEEAELKPEDFSEYNLVTYPFAIDYDAVEEFNEQKKKFLEYGDSQKFEKSTVLNIEKVCLSLKPSLNVFLETLDKILLEGTSCLQAFLSFAKHPSMKKYYAILEEWEEHEDSQEPSLDNNLLNPVDWIDIDLKFSLEKSIKKFFQDEFRSAEQYLQIFRRFLQADWEYSKIDYNVLMSKNLAKPGTTYQSILNLLLFQKQLFEKEIPHFGDLGLFRVDSQNFKAELIEKPALVQEEIITKLIEALRMRFKICKEWFAQSVNHLKEGVNTLEHFVNQINSSSEIGRKFDFYNDQVKSSKEVIDTVKKFQIEIPKDVIQLYNECRSLEQSLTQQKQIVDENITKSKSLYVKQINEETIPQLQQKCAELQESLKDPRYIQGSEASVITELQDFLKLVGNYQCQFDQITQYKKVLEVQSSKLDQLQELKQDIQIKILLRESHTSWFEEVQNWKQTLFKDIQIEEIQQNTEKHQKNVSKIRKRISSTNALLSELDKDVKAFQSLTPILSALRNNKLNANHLKQIEEAVGIPLDFKNMTLKDFLNPSILDQQKLIIGISVQVTQEALLREKLSQIEKKFGELTFPLIPFKEDNPKDSTYILGDTTDLVNEVDVLIMTINQIYGSRHLLEYKKLTADKRKDILMLQELLLEWIKFQRSYVYLESIFSQPEIKKPLQIEVKEFEDHVNKSYKANIKKIIGIQSIAQLTKQRLIESYLQTFRKQNVKLHELNNKINNFLDLKREKFPRFYFVSNDELIFILANYDSATAVQSFVGKLFENVHRLDFADEKSIVFNSVISREGEVFALNSPVNIKSESVEKWLEKLDNLIKKRLFQAVKEGLQSYVDIPREEWYLSHSAQILSVITQYAWTVNAESFLQNIQGNEDEDLKEILSETESNLSILIQLVRRSLQPDQRASIVALITNEVHNRDILEQLITENIQSPQEFLWQQQLRYYFDEHQERNTALIIKQINATQKYGYEYYGPCSRIVITPLTDRCWITITSALHMKLGAAPQGPAGTGKTESTKDLAKSLGRFCLVFNCSDQIDYKMMEKLFRGVIQQGAWTCLDEFNRIDIEVLSVIAQQLLEMRLALLQYQSGEQFSFGGAPCLLVDTCGVFITMNPGYAGRTELPDNLKALFRPISMMIPDYRLIAEILLFSEGFGESKVLAAKMIKLYKLSSEQLSQQKHYDFGMRSVKSVLVMAGKLKAADIEGSIDESLLLIKALIDSNVPKFLKQDLPLFNALIQDLFPNIIIPEQKNELLRAQCAKSLTEKKLDASEAILDKLGQLHETMNVRFGTMLVGSALTGKSEIIKALFKGCNNLHIENKNFPLISKVTLNPKAVTMGELYGEESSNKDWVDGLASHYIRQGTSTPEGARSWICFDGPVDALWIENMNSVLDDSRMLCLSNGQRIRLNERMRILFEVDTLRQASPATVSRCGMVYVAPEILGWESLVKSWVNKISSNSKLKETSFEFLKELFASNTEAFITYFSTLETPLEIVVNQCVLSVCNLLENLLSEQGGFQVGKEEDYEKRFVQVAFVFALAWGFGGCLDDHEAEKFDNFIKKKFMDVEFSADSITNCYIDPDDLQLKLYSSKLQPYEFDKKSSFWELLVPTVDTTKLSYIISLYINTNKNIFLTGGSGTGKTVLATNLLKLFSQSKNIDTLKFNFSARTESNTVQQSLMDGLFLLSQKARGARFGRKNIVFIDDVNMPQKEEYGAQPPIELLRQLFDLGYLYDRKEKHKVTISDTYFLCLGAPPEGGRTSLSTRFTRHFNVLCFPEARSFTIARIFNSLLETYLSGFQETVRTRAHDIVNASIEFYERICKEKLPTPTKFHYTFNLRDLSKVFMGLSLAKESTVASPTQLIQLWVHELQRVFKDRLNSQEDKIWFDNTVNEITENILNVRPKTLNLETVIFSELFSIGDEEVLYEQITDREKLQKTLFDYQLDYNDKHKNKLSLVFFEQAFEHFLRILRVLRSSRGNAMLVGVGGLGKQSLTKIASFIAGYEFKELQQTGTFNIDIFKEFLRKEILIECASAEKGYNGKPLCLLFEDSSISDQVILEDVNNLLNSGEVPNLFSGDDKEKLQAGLIDLYSAKGLNLEQSEAWKIFVERVRSNLHIIMCMSPVGENLKIWCRQFPAFVNCCTIDWFDNWSGAALESVSLHKLKGYKVESIEEVCKYVRVFHQKGEEIAERFSSEMKRKFFITPKTALDNIELFCQLLDLKKGELLQRISDFQKGSVKLEEMGTIVAQLKIDLKEAQPLLVKQQELASKKLIELEKTSKIANEKKQKVEKEASIIQVKKEQIEMITNQANAQLSESLPRIQKAENEVRNIDRKQLNILRNLSQPPKMIEFIFSTVCLALNEKYVNWKDTGRKMIKDLNKFIEKLICKIDDIKEKGADVISPQILKNLQNNLENEFFSDKKLETNIIAKPLGNWCHAIYDFANLKKQVEPLEKNVREMQQKLDEATIEYNEIADDLQKCTDEFQILQNDFDSMQKKQKELEQTIESSKVKLIRAEKLTDLLSDEGERWKQNVSVLNKEQETLTGDIFVASAYISYIGPLSFTYRNLLRENWINEIQKSQSLKISENYSFTKVLGDPLILQNWTLQGLPSDQVSQSSGIITMQSKKYPFLIDPQFQAIKWLKNALQDETDYLLLKNEMSQKKLIESFKNAIQNGYKVLFEGCKDSIWGPLEPVIQRQQFFNSMDQQMMINFNEENIFFNENFKLFLITKIANPQFLPDIFIKTNVINFTVTHKGLEDQLLAEVMKLERPEDEKTKNENIEKISQFQQNMKDLEQKILILLVECKNSPVEDENLVETLQYSKNMAKEITSKMTQIEKISKEIQITREFFRSVAETGSIIFFVIQEISQIDPMYQYSLQAIIKLFKQAIQKTQEQSNSRIAHLKENIIKTIYGNVQRGVFVAHKTILSFLLAINFQLKTQKLSYQKWELFLKGCGVIDRAKYPKNPDPSFINEFDWDLLNILESEFNEFQGITKSIIDQQQIWKETANHQSFPINALPDNIGEKLQIFDQLLLTKVLKPQKLLDQIRKYISEKLGDYFLNSLENSPDQIYKESDNQTPIIFVLSKGADPSSLVKKLGQEKGFKLYEKLLPISLGQGQGERASRLIEEGIKEGQWILLENCHLAKTWMPALEKQIEVMLSLNPEQIHSDFRLFLTSMPASYFPVSILQNSMKITTEPPKGIRANVIRSIQNFSEDYFDQALQKNILGKMTIGLTFFHAVVQERRKFGPLGWNIAYEFNNSDLEAASSILNMFLNDVESKKDIQWDSILFLTGLITYGGRVSDDLDRRLLLTTLKKFYCENILNDHYRFCPFDDYKIPKEASKKIYLEFANSLPENDAPEVFGLHPNANITYKNQEVFKILETVKMVMPASSNNSANNNTEKIQDLIKKFLDSESGITKQLNFQDGHKQHFEIGSNGLIPSLSTVLMQEIARFNILTSKISYSLQNLDLAVQGKISMSTELDSIYSALLDNKVPEAWKAVAYPSLKSLGSWFLNLQQRIIFIKKWLMQESITHFWLPGLFFPQGFLTGVLQTHARKMNEPIDQFAFTFKATDFHEGNEEVIAPEDGVLISGLFLEGANWDLKRKGIVDSLPGKMFVKMPMIHFLPKSQIDVKSNLYSCPLYKTTERAGTLSTTGQSTNFILEVALPCDKSPDIWVMKGVALFCELRN